MAKSHERNWPSCQHRATATHLPIPHTAVVETLVDTLSHRHIGVVGEEFAVSAALARQSGPLGPCSPPVDQFFVDCHVAPLIIEEQALHKNQNTLRMRDRKRPDCTTNHNNIQQAAQQVQCQSFKNIKILIDFKKALIWSGAKDRRLTTLSPTILLNNIKPFRSPANPKTCLRHWHIARQRCSPMWIAAAYFTNLIARP